MSDAFTEQGLHVYEFQPLCDWESVLARDPDEAAAFLAGELDIADEDEAAMDALGSPELVDLDKETVRPFDDERDEITMREAVQEHLRRHPGDVPCLIASERYA